jgi:intracellular sulfur oxidation DsrE/DsrF family protein
MKIGSKSLVMVVFTVATMLALLFMSVPEKRPEAPTVTADTTPESVASTEELTAKKYYFDVVDHSADDFKALLHRAYMIYEQSPLERRRELQIVMVLHGPDIEYFDAANYAENQEIVDLAAKLDAFGVFDFKVCARTAARLGVMPDEIPAFVEFVAYGPLEITRLDEAGYVRL